MYRMKKFSTVKPIKEEIAKDVFDKFELENTYVPPSKTEVIVKSEPSKFVSKIFESREMAHVYHMQITGDGSYAGHKALEDYYTGILDLNDSLIEIYAGEYDIIENYEIIDTSSTQTLDKLDYFIQLAEFIKNTRYKAFLKEDTHLHNIIDEMVSLVYHTIYKIKYLK